MWIFTNTLIQTKDLVKNQNPLHLPIIFTHPRLLAPVLVHNPENKFTRGFKLRHAAKEI